MADTIFIEEYGSIISGNNNRHPQVPSTPLATHEVVIGVASDRNSIIFNTKTQFLIIFADVDAKFVLGDNTVVAVQSDRHIPGGFMRSIARNKASQTNLAVIARV